VGAAGERVVAVVLHADGAVEAGWGGCREVGPLPNLGAVAVAGGYVGVPCEHPVHPRVLVGWAAVGLEDVLGAVQPDPGVCRRRAGWWAPDEDAGGAVCPVEGVVSGRAIGEVRPALDGEVHGGRDRRNAHFAGRAVET